MGRFKLTALMGMAALSMSLFSTARADQLFDNHEDGTNQNEFEYYWYYYDDNAGFGADDRPLAAPSSQPSVIDVPYTTKARAGFGANFIYVEDPTDTWEVKVYEFAIGEETGNKYATMPFTLGEVWTASYGNAQPYVATGAMLCGDGKSIDLTGTEGIRFKLRSHVNDLIVRFKVQDYDIDTFSIKPTPPEGAFGYHGKNVTTTAGEWTEHEVYWEDLKQPGTWAWDDEFSIDRVTKVAWEVCLDANSSTTTDTLDIDDVEFIGTYEFVSEYIDTSTAPMTPPVDANGNTIDAFATFDVYPENQSPLGTYWYAYNDAEIGGNSAVTLGAEINDATGLLNLNFVENSGSGGAGQGAALEFELGDPIPQSQSGGREIQISGFVGIGINLYDSARVEYFDADSAGVTGVYFHYMLDGDAQWATLEISDYYDVPDADDPTRKDGRGSGVVWFINLPPTNGEWVAKQIDFSNLKCHTDWEGAQNIPLDLTRLAKAQWKVQGGKGISGLFAIDNIYLTTVPSSPVIHTARTVQPSAFRAALVNGNIKISLDNSIVNGTAKLVNTRGMVVGTTSFAKNSVANFSTKTLPAGAYFVRVNGTDAKGKAVTMQSAINLVK